MTVAVRRACLALTRSLRATIASGRLSPVWHGALIIVLTFVSVGWVHGAMRRYRPAGIVWPLLRAAAVLNAVCTVAGGGRCSPAAGPRSGSPPSPTPAGSSSTCCSRWPSSSR